MRIVQKIIIVPGFVMCILFLQGDIERRELHLDPPPMLDRRASLSSVQLGFIDNICTSLYKDMVVLEDSFSPMLEGCLANRKKWAEMNKDSTQEDPQD